MASLTLNNPYIPRINKPILVIKFEFKKILLRDFIFTAVLGSHNIERKE